MLQFILARLKPAAAAVGIAVGTAFVEAVNIQLVKYVGIGLPVEAKASITAAITGFLVNYTDNVKLLSDGHAEIAPTLPKAA